MKKIGMAILVILFLVGVYIRTCVWTGGDSQRTQTPLSQLTPANLRPMTYAERLAAAKSAQNPSIAPNAQAAPNAPATNLTKLRPFNRTQPEAKLIVHYDATGTPRYKAYAEFVQQTQLFNDLVTTVNGLIPLQKDLVIKFTEVGEPNAFYSQKEDSISVGYEFVESFYKSYKGPEADRMDFVRGATYFFVLHELGHALIHRLDLPVGSHEEDAADEFATILLLQQGYEGQEAILASAQYFKDTALAAAQNGEVPELSDEHSLNIQRFYTIISWIYGVDPYRHVHLVASGLLPEERAGRAHDEYLALRKRWKFLLDSKLRTPLK